MPSPPRGGAGARPADPTEPARSSASADFSASADSSASSASDTAPSTREETRQRVVRAAVDLLTRGGRDAVTTRAVADAAGLQPPAIYRLFGDKEGLLDAVAEHGFTAFLATKHVDPEPQDPVEDLRAGWDVAAEFGLANPALFTLMYTEPSRASSPAFETGMAILRDRIRRLAAGGWLRVDEELAVQIIHATVRGAVLTWLSLPEERRTTALLTALREAMVAAVTTRKPSVEIAGPAGSARALSAALPDQTPLSSAEEYLLREWLGRLTADG